MYGVTGEPRDLGSLTRSHSPTLFSASAPMAPRSAEAPTSSSTPSRHLPMTSGFRHRAAFCSGATAVVGTTLVHSYPSSGCVDFGCGAVYRFNPAGGIPFAIRVFKEFDGSRPAGGVTEGPDGRLFGLTSEGGSNGLGVLYAIANSGAIPVQLTGPSSVVTGTREATYTMQFVSPAGSKQDCRTVVHCWCSLRSA